MKGKFIVLYGINNIGKTTQAKKLISYLESKKYKTFYFKIPVYNLEPTGPIINKILRSGKQEISEDEFQKIYAQNRKDFQETVKKKLDEGYITIAEDYVGTGLAWGSVKGSDINYLKKINEDAAKEDLAILLDGERFLTGKEKNHIHEDDENLIKKVRKKHLELAKELDWKIVDANQTREEVFEEIKKEVDKIL